MRINKIAPNLKRGMTRSGVKIYVKFISRFRRGEAILDG